MANTFGFVGIGVSGLALLCEILALSLKYWNTLSERDYFVNGGLWEYCVTPDSTGEKECTALDSSNVPSDDWPFLQAIRAMVFLGLFATVAAIVSGALVMFVLKSKTTLYFLAGGLDIAAGIFTMTAVAIYLAELKTDKVDLHAAFALAVIAWITAWIGAGCLVGAKLMEKE